jgi:hypothetical protein
MHQSKVVFAWCAVLIVFLLIQGCAGAKIPQATKKDSASLGITIEASSHTSLLTVESVDLKQVFFIKLANKEDTLTKDIILKSNYYYAPFMSGFQAGGMEIFLLDIEPGFYAAVGGIGKGHATKVDFLIFFPEQMVKETITEIKSNTIVYMGKFVMSQVSVFKRMNNPDRIQQFFFNTKLFDEEQRYYGKMVISNNVNPQFHSPTMESFEKSNDKEMEFLARHKTTFKSTDWANNINHRLEMLQK